MKLLADYHELLSTVGFNFKLRRYMKVKYEGFIKRQEAQVARQAGKMNKPIPPGLDYHAITTLRMEAGSRLPLAFSQPRYRRSRY